MPVELNEFEKRVLDALFGMCGPDERLLRAQLATVTELDRDFTGPGYYLNFAMPSLMFKLSPGSYPLGHVSFEVEGVEHGGGALLWIDDGQLASLEVYLHGEGKWPAEPRLTNLETFAAK